MNLLSRILALHCSPNETNVYNEQQRADGEPHYCSTVQQISTIFKWNYNAGLARPHTLVLTPTKAQTMSAALAAFVFETIGLPLCLLSYRSLSEAYPPAFSGLWV